MSKAAGAKWLPPDLKTECGFTGCQWFYFFMLVSNPAPEFFPLFLLEGTALQRSVLYPAPEQEADSLVPYISVPAPTKLLMNFSIF